MVLIVDYIQKEITLCLVPRLRGGMQIFIYWQRFIFAAKHLEGDRASPIATVRRSLWPVFTVEVETI